MARIPLEKLQHIYDLRPVDFGLSGNKNPQQLQRLNHAIESHLAAQGTSLVHGHYRGSEAFLYYNTQTRNVVVTDRSGNVVAGFKASSAQAAYILAKGRLS